MNKILYYTCATAIMIGVNTLAFPSHGEASELQTKPEWRSAGKAADGYRKPGTGIDVNYTIESLDQVGDFTSLHTQVLVNSPIDLLNIALNGQGIDILSRRQINIANPAVGTAIPISTDILAVTEGEQKMVMTITTVKGADRMVDVISIPVEIGDISFSTKPQASSIINGEEVVVMQLDAVAEH